MPDVVFENPVLNSPYRARIDDGHGRDDLLNLIVEVSGEDLKEKAAKASHSGEAIMRPASLSTGGTTWRPSRSQTSSGSCPAYRPRRS